MTVLTYECVTKEGKKVEVKTYAEALKIKAEGGTFKPKYTKINQAGGGIISPIFCPGASNKCSIRKK